MQPSKQRAAIFTGPRSTGFSGWASKDPVESQSVSLRHYPTFEDVAFFAEL